MRGTSSTIVKHDSGATSPSHEQAPFDNASNLEKRDTEKRTGQTQGEKVPKHHVEVFAVNQEEGEPNYRAVGVFSAFVLLLKSQIGLGVLALPQTFSILGIVPGLIVIIAIGLITTYADIILGDFAVHYGSVHNLGDVGFILGGTLGREVLGTGYMLFQIFLAASGILAGSIAFNAISTHGTCTIVFAVVSAIIVGSGASLRTFKHVSMLVWVGAVSILTAIMIVLIAVGVVDRPAAAPPGDFDLQLRAFGNPTFADGMVAVVNILFAWAGSPGYFSVIAEMRQPQQYRRAMIASQLFCGIFYSTVAIVLWRYCGIYVASPALGSAGPLIKKVAYGLALPGVLAGPIIQTHLAAKFGFVRILRGTVHLQKSTKTHWITWISMVVSCVGLAWIIGMVIPFFSSLIGLVGALFGSLFCISIFGWIWIFENDHKRKEGPTSLRYKLCYANAVMFIVIGLFLCGAGFYGSVVSIKAEFDKGTVGSPFSCADNSGSVPSS